MAASKREDAPFGRLLRAYRMAAGLSQDELAERAGLSRRGISDLERGARRSPYPASARRLADALGLSAADRAALLASAHAVVSAAAARPTQPRLPVSLTSFVGRERDIADVRRLLQRTRLLTLTGPGGIGKTRLALEVARSSAAAAFVDLVPVPDGSLVAAATAAALGIAERPRVPLLDLLATTLAARDALLVLDNCEHVVTACAELADHLLRACPALRILATSRQPLAVAGEQLWPVAPLPVGGPIDAPGADLSEAVRLFAERARLVQPDFELSDRNVAAVGEICRRLDGIPLAIELAAARVRVFGLERLAARVDEGLQLLKTEVHGVPARQQTLRAAIDWSYVLLSGQEQACFRRLSVFTGGWTEEAAAAIVPDTDGMHADELLDLVTRLVDRSLVQVEPGADGVMRYGMLETIRDYALGQLRANGEEAALRLRHAAYFLALAEEGEPELWGPQPEPWLRRIEQDLDNYRAAITWLVDSTDVAQASRLGAALGRFWLVAGRYAEGEALVARLLRLAPAEGPTLVRARLMRANASLLAFQGDAAAAQPLAEAALAALRVLGPDREIARALILLGDTVQTRGDIATARRLLDEAVAVSRRAGATVELVDALHYLSGDALAAGEYDRAHAHADDCLAVARQAGYGRGVARALRALGSIAYIEHDGVAAHRHLEAGLAAAHDVGDWWETAQAAYWLGHLAADEGHHAAAAALLGHLRELGQQLGDAEIMCAFLEGAAHLAAASGQPERALRLAGAAATQRKAIDSVLFPVLEGLIDQWLAPARMALGSKRTRTAFAAGQGLSREQAVAEALG
jgi:predicted ATPase/DNA-binding XRE family transcriptional regulator